MTKQDVLNGARGKPTPFTIESEGFTCLLRPLTWGERKELFEWHAANKASTESALELQTRLIVAGVCNEQGEKILTAEDMPGIALPIADAIAKEVSRRNGLDGKAGEPGKAESPATRN